MLLVDSLATVNHWVGHENRRLSIDCVTTRGCSHTVATRCHGKVVIIARVLLGCYTCVLVDKVDTLVRETHTLAVLRNLDRTGRFVVLARVDLVLGHTGAHLLVLLLLDALDRLRVDEVLLDVASTSS